MSWFRRKPVDPELALDRLAVAIGLAAAKSAVAIDDAIVIVWNEEGAIAARRLTCLNEFVFFFMHHVNRVAFRSLDPAARARLQRELGPRVVTSTINATVGSWPEELRARIQSGIWNGLNERELQYATCTELWLDGSKDSIINEDGSLAQPKALVNRLVVHLMESVFDRRMSVELYRGIVDQVRGVIKATDFKRLVADAAGVT